MLQSLNITIDNIVSSNGDALDQSKITSTVIDTNNKFTEHLCDIAANCFKQTKNNKKRQSNKPWFNWQTTLGKRELRKATTAASEHTTNSFIRENVYKVKGNYIKILSKTSNKFFEQLNSDIENGKVLNWQAFKKLKSHKTNKIQHDSYDMDKFETLFRELYSDTHKTTRRLFK